MLKCGLITLQDGCSPVNLLHVFRHLFLRTPLGGCFCISIYYHIRCQLKLTRVVVEIFFNDIQCPVAISEENFDYYL